MHVAPGAQWMTQCPPGHWVSQSAFGSHHTTQASDGVQSALSVAWGATDRLQSGEVHVGWHAPEHRHEALLCDAQSGQLVGSLGNAGPGGASTSGATSASPEEPEDPEDPWEPEGEGEGDVVDVAGAPASRPRAASGSPWRSDQPDSSEHAPSTGASTIMVLARAGLTPR